MQSALTGELIDYANPAFGNAGISGNGENVRTYHITYGNQNYRTFSVITDWTQAQLKQQLALIDELIAADASLETLQFLQNARLTLAGRLAK